MARTLVFLVGDDHEMKEKIKNFGQSHGCMVKTFTPMEWSRTLNDGSLRVQLTGEVPALSVGQSPVEEGAKILQFPMQQNAGGSESHDKKVRTMNELESLAIENAIFEFNGNLTEAAKALGIGRATLYRKVKQYNIDPSMARRRKAA
jgi:DNA-binding NtrC family response regulator